MKHKEHKPRNLFEEYAWLAQFHQLKDPLERLKKRIDFEAFRSLLERALDKPNAGVGGCKPYDYSPEDESVLRLM